MYEKMIKYKLEKNELGRKIAENHNGKINTHRHNKKQKSGPPFH